ncbi:MAG: DUF222 domain-containing protein [Microthrixaceae bacterium]
MTLVPVMSRQERVGLEAEARCASLMGQMNVAAADLVEVIAEVLDAEAWGPGGGLRSPEHWVTWRTGVSPARAARLVQIARRLGDLPLCVALFRTGGLTEDAMALIAAKAPAERDRELADLGPMLLHTQLTRILAHLPDQAGKPKRERERKVTFGFDDDGWWGLNATLPADEGALVHKALEAARSEIFHERQPDADPSVRGPVGWADGLVRLAETGLDALDPATRRGEARGERAQIIVHLDGRSDGNGHARIHLGPELPDALRRYLCCDAKVRTVIEDHNGALLGISPLEPTVNPRLRAVIEQRDQGCRYPGCTQRRWVQVHHLIHREDGGLTIASNLLCLCPYHHRLHHHNAFTITGDPETPAGLRFVDHWGCDIGPPHHGPLAPPAHRADTTFTPPTGEPLTRWFTWN